MKTIWKAAIQPNSQMGEPFPIKVQAPQGSAPVSVGVQDGQVCVWFEADTDAPPGEFTLWCVGTGFGRVPDLPAVFIGTVQHHGYVWHLYG